MISIGDLGSRRPTWAFQRTHYWTHKIQDGGDPPMADVRHLGF